MIYYSQVTAKGNTSFSHDSQADADAKAKSLDYNGCSGCSDCSDCSDCSGCSDCSRCSRCSRCSYCFDCSRCSDVLDGSKGVIQAGQPDNWPCYGWLQDGKLTIHCGCRRKTFAEAVEYWSNKPNRQEVLIACHMIASIATVRGWATA